MNITEITDESKPSILTKSHRIMGVVANRTALVGMSTALSGWGVTEMETLAGVGGAVYLSEQEHSFQGLLDRFLGDMETKMRAVYAKAIQEGQLVFALSATTENKDAIQRIVNEHHAKHVVSFGNFVNESLSPL